MAKIFTDMLGVIIGSIGNVSYYMRYSDNIVRRKGAERKGCNSPDAVKQRAIFGLIAKLASILQVATTIGFPTRKRGLSPSNVFHQLNNSICTVEGNQVTVDYEHMLCANGPLVIPEVSVSYSASNKTFSFEQTCMEEEVNCNADDSIHAVLLESNQFFCRIVELRERGENGKTSVALPETRKFAR